MALRSTHAGALIGLLAVAGCGQQLGSVSGKVTFRDRVVVYGTVFALCSDGITRPTNIEPDGSYRFENLPTGQIQFAVISPEPAEVDLSARRAGRGGGPMPGSAPAIDKSKWFAIPEEFGDPRRSNVSFTLNAVGMVYNIQLR